MKNSPVHSLPPRGYANTWLIEENDRFMAVDVSTGHDAKQLCRYMRDTLNVSLEQLVVITATHFHVDHIGGIEALLSHCPRAQVHFNSRVGNYISGKEGLAVPPLSRWIMGAVSIAPRIPRALKGSIYGMGCPTWGTPTPLMRKRNAVSYDARCDLVDGSTPDGFPSWQVIETPGHTPDSICFYNEKDRILITGDTILNLRGRGELNSFCACPEDIRSSYNRLLDYPVESIYPGHGRAIIGKPGLLKHISRRGLEG